MPHISITLAEDGCELFLRLLVDLKGRASELYGSREMWTLQQVKVIAGQIDAGVISEAETEWEVVENNSVRAVKAGITVHQVVRRERDSLGLRVLGAEELLTAGDARATVIFYPVAKVASEKHVLASSTRRTAAGARPSSPYASLCSLVCCPCECAVKYRGGLAHMAAAWKTRQSAKIRPKSKLFEG